MKNLDKDTFQLMIDDWKADHWDDEDIQSLAIEEPRYETDQPYRDDEWVAYAEDDECVYILTANEDGNIEINYIGTK